MTALFTSPNQALAALQPQPDPTMPNAPPQNVATPSSPNVDQIAKILGQMQGTPAPNAQAPMAPVGNGQNTAQMTPQGYPVNGNAQQQNQQNFMGQQPQMLGGLYGG